MPNTQISHICSLFVACPFVKEYTAKYTVVLGGEPESMMPIYMVTHYKLKYYKVY